MTNNFDEKVFCVAGLKGILLKLIFFESGEFSLRVTLQFTSEPATHSEKNWFILKTKLLNTNSTM